MKGLVPVGDQPNTRESGQAVEGVGFLASEGVGVVVPREESYAGVSIDYPSDQENLYELIRIPRHSAAKALDNTEESVYEQVGKPPIFGRPHYRRAFTINSKTLTIDQSPLDGRGKMSKIVYDLSLKVTRGFQMALSDGANIEVPSSAPFGSSQEVAGFSPVNLSDLYAR